MNPSSLEILATTFFALAVIHTFMVKRFASMAHHHPEGSFKGTLMHFLAETEVAFGLWAAALFMGLAALQLSVSKAVTYIEGLNFTEPKFVFIVMVVAATRPVVQLAEKIIGGIARLLPFQESLGFYISALTVGPLLGSFITEPAAMTLLALLLKRRYFDQGINSRLAYVTLGLLFVNISIGGTLTHFAAPPVLMVAAKWQWGTVFMLEHFGWRAALSCLVSTAVVALLFRKQLRQIPPVAGESGPVPPLLILAHVCFLALVVAFAHYPDVIFGIFMIFLGLVTATSQFQDQLKLREGLLVGFFLAGLVVLGSLQAWWLQPLLTRLDGGNLFFGATALTAITDNAALTYLGTLVQNLTEDQKYALVAGAVTGGGLTVIANAPNPAGIGILQSSKAFIDGISPLGLFLGALFPTVVAVGFFWFVK
jgi:Na+/H+ antiporter NhaD/arsenite permease-like protein